MSNNNFQKHPSHKLINFYKLKNFQGANPSDAKILFVGKDPNWSIDIEELSIFNLVEEYLANGVQFWKKYNIHHPFLHPKYTGDGKKYHNSISRLNLNKEYSDRISFIEIIGFHTTGMSSTNKKQYDDYVLSSENKLNLIEIDNYLNNSDKLIFLYWGLINYLKYLNKKTGLFKKFAHIDKKLMNRTDLNKIGNIYFHKHFSMGISPETLKKISNEVINYLN